MNTITSRNCPIAQQFCAFCLHGKLPKVEFYKHIVGCSAEQQQFFQSILGYDFRLHSFAICKPCWEIMQLIQDFRLRCLKANSLVECIEAGLRCEDDWFSAWNLAKIESIKTNVKNQLVQIEKVEIRVQVENESDGNQQQKQSGTDEAPEQDLMSTLDIGEVKVELNEVNSDNGQLSITKTDELAINQQLNQIVCKDSAQEDLKSIVEIGEVKIEPELGDEDDESANQGTSGLIQCKKCSRIFERKGFHVHFRRCDGNIPASIFECPLCPLTFKSVYKLNVHVNKHTGEAPFKCSKHCENGFFSKVDLRRHEMKCGRFRCTLCDRTAVSQKLMNDHYAQEHPGERRFPCSQCDKGFTILKHLKRHQQLHTPEGPVKPHTCVECNKSFVDRSKLQKHMMTHTEWKQFQCEHCDKQIKHRVYLEIHVASQHPELATERAKEKLAHMRKRWRKRKLERKALKTRGPEKDQSYP